jgi:tetratricopeptide (TPR) repeat protein
MTAKKLQEQGVAAFRKENYEAALAKFNEALVAAADDPKLTAEIYNDIGVTQKQLEDFPAAHAALDEAWNRFTELDDKKGQAQTLGNRATVLEDEELLEEAVETYKQSATLLEEIGENEMAMYVWQAVSRLRMGQKQYIAAIGAYEEGVENMPKGSFKRKILQQLMKLPGNMLGGSFRGSSEPEDDK